MSQLLVHFYKTGTVKLVMWSVVP